MKRSGPGGQNAARRRVLRGWLRGACLAGLLALGATLAAAPTSGAVSVGAYASASLRAPGGTYLLTLLGNGNTVLATLDCYDLSGQPCSNLSTATLTLGTAPAVSTTLISEGEGRLGGEVSVPSGTVEVPLTLAAEATGLAPARWAWRLRCESDGSLGLAPATRASGRLLAPMQGTLWQLDGGEGPARPVLSVGATLSLLGASWTPDERHVAYSLYSWPEGEAAPYADIVVAAADGSGARPLFAHSAPGEQLGPPAWAPDGSALYFDVRPGGQAGDAKVRVERGAADGSGRSVVLPGAYQPSVSPDGTSLVFVHDDPGGPILGVSGLMGEAPRGVLPPGVRFGGILSPRFSPDGRWIAFAATSPSRARAPSLLDLLGVRPARAHGLPWEIYLVQPDGTDLRQLTDMAADLPNLAWAPDGSRLAVLTETGLFQVDIASGSALQVAGPGGYATIDWAR